MNKQTKDTGTTKKQSVQKTQKVYRDRKKGWIERLADYFATKMDLSDDPAHPPVGNLRRFFGYLIDFFLANLLVCIPIVFIQSVVNDTTEITQDLRVVPLSVAYGIVAVVFLFYVFYYVYIPWKVWPGQTPAKRLLGIKIVMTNNEDVTLKALFLRNVVGFVVVEGTVFMTSFLIQLITLTMGYETVPALPGQVYLFITFISILVTMTNKHRRMFHDFIGGTKIYKIDESKERYHSF